MNHLNEGDGRAVGKVIDLLQYKAGLKENTRDGIYMEIMPPAVLIKYYRNGVVVKQHQVISEDMLRDLLDEMR
jgi:hypothetical protein